MDMLSSLASIGPFLGGFVPLYHALFQSSPEKIETLKNALIQIEVFHKEAENWSHRCYGGDLRETQRKYYQLVENHLNEAIRLLERLEESKLLLSPLYEIKDLSKHIPSYLELSEDQIRMTGPQRAANAQKLHESEEKVSTLSKQTKKALSKLIFPSRIRRLILFSTAATCFAVPLLYSNFVIWAKQEEIISLKNDISSLKFKISNLEEGAEGN